MTEQNLPPQDLPSSDSQASPPQASLLDLRAAASNEPEAAAPNGSGGPGAARPDDRWETVSFPGTLPLNEIANTVLPPPKGPVPKVADFTQREAELLQLIQDLNQCNDALLGRVGHLEDALERAEAALQIEVERAQQSQSMSSAEAQAAIAQQQQQVAQLLSELDVANDAVRRTTIHNETFQAELDNARQRVAQLERECTLLQQRFGEKNTALQQAEATCRDLRSRLQRQQHYTLQFKAALEKCLDMSVQRSPAPPAIEFPAVVTEPTLRPHPLAMPKAEQIKPWASHDEAPIRPDPSLDTLLRNLKSVGQGPRTPAPSAVPTRSAAVPTPPVPAPDPEAERLLWQDLERVIDSAPTVEPPAAKAADPLPAAQPAPTVPVFTEPSPWGAPLAPPTAAIEPAVEPELAFELEPRPPLLETTPTVQPPTSTPEPVAASAGRPAALPPLLNSAASAPAASTSPSPVVYPLRPQRKLKSVAAVELPSFPRPQRSQSPMS
ncbi:hypothetical protein [Pseudanabaena sp. FACHB-2040]|uniref:hypothetical protein n=1 Tax=Pseudanabaena sp. FACHB-2040 TaxID=2692859 RepID=UPI00168A3C87|nr:hypothetical protein [Pseudanabaena sp. FACHB-2040]MBD2260668.1 hypothetical protein [Pseudanabaena sp. FACHB-2040]